MIKRTAVTYGQLDGALQAMGFSRRLLPKDSPALRYKHKPSGAMISLPPFAEGERVLDYHLVAVRTTLDNFGVADPTAFAAELQKAG
jgi:hypothetical protein